MIILAIETSCDETSISIIENRNILANVIFTSLLISEGVIPDIASKIHISNINKVFEKCINQSKISLEQINFIGYTSEPGLAICLQIGAIFAKTLGLYLDVPVIPLNHLLSHAYASLNWGNEDFREWVFPVLSFIVSGGHTQMYKIENHLDSKIIGWTLDDAVGECFDKVSVMLKRGYPGGPIIEKLAKNGNNYYKFKIPKNDRSLEMSFSGLKSNIKRIIEKGSFNESNLCYSLQDVVARTLLSKIKLAITNDNYNTLVLAGGVMSNDFLRNYLKDNLSNFGFKNVVFPKKNDCTDNALMVAINCYYKIFYLKNNVFIEH